jgi:hypothetical protein
MLTVITRLLSAAPVPPPILASRAAWRDQNSRLPARAGWRSLRAHEITLKPPGGRMAKGQLRSNREAKKPKKKKETTIAAAPARPLPTLTAPPKKKA